jgi:hypothetical protein
MLIQMIHAAADTARAVYARLSLASEVEVLAKQVAELTAEAEVNRANLLRAMEILGLRDAAEDYLRHPMTADGDARMRALVDAALAAHFTDKEATQ